DHAVDDRRGGRKRCRGFVGFAGLDRLSRLADRATQRGRGGIVTLPVDGSLTRGFFGGLRIGQGKGSLKIGPERGGKPRLAGREKSRMRAKKRAAHSAFWRRYCQCKA